MSLADDIAALTAGLVRLDTAVTGLAHVQNDIDQSLLGVTAALDETRPGLDRIRDAIGGPNAPIHSAIVHGVAGFTALNNLQADLHRASKAAATAMAQLTAARTVVRNLLSTLN